MWWTKTYEGTNNHMQINMENKQWPQAWTQSLIIPTLKKGNLNLCNNYRTISMINHANKVMLKVLLNRLENGGNPTRRTGRVQTKEKYIKADIQQLTAK